ncbi:MAG: hypothetical protein HQM00_01880 [Magnetococcales bacterium]|nr:hypothetical protein [Magnetococcales bacterium]
MSGAEGDPHGALLHEVLLGLGRIQGSVEQIRDTQKVHTNQLMKLDERVDGLEGSVKTHSVVGGGVVAACVAVGVELIKSRFAGS